MSNPYAQQLQRMTDLVKALEARNVELSDFIKSAKYSPVDKNEHGETMWQARDRILQGTPNPLILVGWTYPAFWPPHESEQGFDGCNMPLFTRGEE